jgi:hypothetical protein
LTTRIVSSSTEAEVNGLVAIGKENIWQREFQKVLGFWENFDHTKIFQDNKSAILLSTGGKCHKRSKHFGLEFDLFRYVALGEMEVFSRPTGGLAADMLTKCLSPVPFCTFRDEVMGGAEKQNS